MIYREANIHDYPSLHKVRLSVKENILVNHSKVTEAHYREMLEERGKGWLCEIDGTVVGFSIVDVREQNVWALFLLPEYMGMGIGKRLQQLMLDWYFGQGNSYLWLTTDIRTRADKFYEMTGWRKVEVFPNGEVKYERFAP